ncbi:MAG: hypothetical protein LBO63_07095 [Oscillospiraceae bacterium]|jgi:hypothetical protein|nr:hypothetical protein [Oscillospiraceae bacterium]
MTEKILPGPNAPNTPGGPTSSNPSIREAVSIHTKKIFDSCRDKDCIEDLRLYLTRESQRIADSAISIRAKTAKLLYVNIDVEEVTFNRGYYTVDLRFFYKVTGDAFTLTNRPAEITGLCVFDKRVILFGSEGNAKIYTSKTILGGADYRPLEYNNLPTAVVEAVDPIVLGMRIVDSCDNCCELGITEIPEQISDNLGGDLHFDPTSRRVLVSLGQFSIVRLERDTQLLMPSYDYFMPQKECIGSADDDPCSLFTKIKFPVDEFFPPDNLDKPVGYKEAKSY